MVFLNKKWLLSASALVCLVLWSSLLFPISAQQDVLIIGVEKGDWAEYGGVSVTWSSNDFKARPEPELVEANNTVWFKVTVANIEVSESEAGVTLESVTHFRNNTETKQNHSVDLYTGVGNGSLMLVRGNLEAGALIYQAFADIPAYINWTGTRVYKGALRDVAILNATFNPTVAPSWIEVSVEYCWDLVTGVLTERRGSLLNRTGDFLTSWYRSDTLVDTNLWKAPDSSSNQGFPPWAWGVAVALVSVSLIAVVLMVRRRARARVRSRRRLRAGRR